MEKEQETRLVQADFKRVGSFSHNPDAYFSRPLCQLTDDLASTFLSWAE